MAEASETPGSAGGQAPSPGATAEESLVERAGRYIAENPVRSFFTATPLAGPAHLAGAAYDYAEEKLKGRGDKGVATGEADVNEKDMSREAYNPPAWAMPADKEVVVGYTKGGMQPNTAQQQQQTQQTEMPEEYWDAVMTERGHARIGTAVGARAEAEHQGQLYDIARDVEDERRAYFEQEKAAASRFASDTTNARIRLEEAHARLAQFGEAPKATINAAFAKANGLQKIAGLAGALLGGVSAAGFSALSHRPEKNPFFEAFDREAGAVVDAWMTDRDTAGKLVGAEREGLDAIRQAFGDDRAAREFVMAGLMNVYKSRLEQAAATYGIDRTRADYQALLSKIDGKYAERMEKAAVTVQNTVAESQKYVPPQPITRRVPIQAVIAKQVDPTLAEETAAFRKEAARYGSRDFWPAELQAKEAELAQRADVIEKQVQQAAVAHLLGRQDEPTEKEIEGYAEAREKRGVNTLENASLAADRIARKLARQGGSPGWLQQYSNMVASGASTGILMSWLGQHAGSDPELYNDLAYLNNEYIKSKSGGAVPVAEMTRMFSAVGAGDAQGISNFSNNLKRELRVREGQLGAQFNRKAITIYHGRRHYDQATQAPAPYHGLRSPE